MSKELERFVRNHRKEFDTEEPGWDVWEKVRQQIEPPVKKRTVLFRLTRATLSAAAALLLLVAGLIWWLGPHRHHTVQKDLAVQPSKSVNTATSGASAAASADDSEQRSLHPIQPGTDSAALAQQAPTQPGHNIDAASGDDTSLINEEMYHYARLVELKQKELKHIQKDEPLLYQQFSTDLHRLDSVYHFLQHQLNNTSNREQLLEAMVQDLQLQMKLLNHQLEVVKQINHFKKASYDSAYKTL